MIVSIVLFMEDFVVNKLPIEVILTLFFRDVASIARRILMASYTIGSCRQPQAWMALRCRPIHLVTPSECDISILYFKRILDKDMDMFPFVLNNRAGNNEFISFFFYS